MQPPTLKDSAETLEFLTTSNIKEVLFFFFVFFVQSFLLCELMYPPPPNTHTHITEHAAKYSDSTTTITTLVDRGHIGSKHEYEH